MRQSTEAHRRYLIDELPRDLAIALAFGGCAGLLAAPLGYFAAMLYFRRSRSLDVAQHQSASIFLGAFAAVVVGIAATVLIFLFRYFRRLYRFPV